MYLCDELALIDEFEKINYKIKISMKKFFFAWTIFYVVPETNFQQFKKHRSVSYHIRMIKTQTGVCCRYSL